MTFMDELDPYRLEIYRMCENELPVIIIIIMTSYTKYTNGKYVKIKRKI